MTKVTTYEGVDIALNEDNGKFVAYINNVRVQSASLDPLKKKIREAHIGNTGGHLEGYAPLPSGSVQYGFTKSDPYTIVGMTSEKGRSRYDPVKPVYVVKRGEGTVQRYASTLAKPNDEAFAKLTALHDEYVSMQREMFERAKKILEEEYERVTVEDVKRMLAESYAPAT